MKVHIEVPSAECSGRLATVIPIRDRPALISEAKDIALRYGLPFAQRGHRTRRRVVDDCGGWILMLRSDGLCFHSEGASYCFHPGSAHLRQLMLNQGKQVHLLTALELQQDDSVLDCTLGQASDGQLIIAQLGPKGSYVGLEQSAPIYWVVAEGLRRAALRWASAPRIEIQHTDHLTYLRQQADNSFDIVYFDPMFRSHIEASTNMEDFLDIANHAPLTKEAFSEARRVARRHVVIKERYYSEVFADLDIAHYPHHFVTPGKRTTSYAVIDVRS